MAAVSGGTVPSGGAGGREGGEGQGGAAYLVVDERHAGLADLLRAHHLRQLARAPRALVAVEPRAARRRGRRRAGVVAATRHVDLRLHAGRGPLRLLRGLAAAAAAAHIGHTRHGPAVALVRAHHAGGGGVDDDAALVVTEESDAAGRRHVVPRRLVGARLGRGGVGDGARDAVVELADPGDVEPAGACRDVARLPHVGTGVGVIRLE